MGTSIIARINSMALDEGQLFLNRGGPLFEWIPGVLIPDNPPIENVQILIEAPNEYARGIDMTNVITQDEGIENRGGD